VTLRYDTAASYRDGTWELVLPLVVAPRYVPGGASGRPTTGGGRSPDTDRAPDASRITPGGGPGAGGKTTVAVRFIDPVDGVTSSSHELAGSGLAYSFVDAKSDHDAVVRWRAPAPASGWVEQDDDGGYAAVVIASTASAARKGALACTLVLDRSATTRGDADALEHPLVHALMGALATGDRIAVTGSDRIPAGSGPDVQRALDEAWVHPAGRFDLTRVLAESRGANPYVLVTDGLVADDAAAIAAAIRLGAPIHVIGIGPAPNRALLAAIANRTNGTVRFAQPGDDLPALARDVLADVGSPPEPLAVSWGTLAASDVVPAVLPRVGTGQAVLVVARVKRAQQANARAHGELFAIETLGKVPPVPGATSAHGALARRWARMRLDELLAGRDPAAAQTHALHYGLVSPLTSMVAIGTEVIVKGGVKHSVAVPVSVPAGMHWQEIRRELSVDTTARDKNVETADRGNVAKEKDDEETAAKHAKGVKTLGDAKPDAKKRPQRKGDEDGDLDEAGAAVAPRAPQAAPTAVSAADNERTLSYGGEVVSETSLASSRRYRVSVGLGLGATFHGGTDAIVSLSARLEIGRLTLVGGELTGALVGGDHGELRALATVARRGLVGGLAEVGAGFGLEVATGAGPAGMLALRFHPTWGVAVTPYLRYDASLLYHAGARVTEQDLTLGVEWHF